MSNRDLVYESNKDIYDRYNEKYENDKRLFMENYNRINDRVNEGINNRKNLKGKFSEFKSKVKNNLLAEAIYHLYEGSVYTLEKKDIAINKGLVANFIIENGGCDNILYKAPHTFALEYLQLNINKYTDIITEKCDKDDPTSYEISKNNLNDFLDDLDQEEDIENIKQQIAIRVANGEEEFINNNNADKREIQDIIDDTQQRINDTRGDDTIDSDTSKDIQEEYANIAKVKIKNVHNNRHRGLFEQAVRHVSERAISDESLKPILTESNGKLDMDKIVYVSKCIYGLLETVNTTKMIKMTPSYLMEQINIL